MQLPIEPVNKFHKTQGGNRSSWCRHLPMLSSRDLVLTVNQRTSRSLLAAQLAIAEQSSPSLIKTPQILPLNTWLTTLLPWLTPTPFLLSPEQCHALWESISSTELAPTLSQAWNIIHQYQIPPRALERFNHSKDVEAYLTAHTDFQTILTRQKAITAAELPTLVISAIQDGQLPPPLQSVDTIWLAGFDQPTPQNTALFSALATHCPLVFETLPSESSHLSRHPLCNHASEIEAMASFAKNHHQAYPNAHIACIVPNLTQHWEEIATVFNHTFQSFPQGTLNLSGGMPLANIPCIETAMILCKATLSNALSAAELCHLLTTPTLYPDDPSRQTAADIHLGLSQSQQLTYSKQACTLQTKPLEALCEWLQLAVNSTERHTYRHWRTQFESWLNTAGWLIDQPILSHTYQALTHWQTALDTLCSLDSLMPKTNAHAALSALQGILKRTLFQPESKKASVEVLGLLEAATLQFDAAWVMGLHDSAWPPAPKPNCHIPHSLARQYNTPHASAEKELVIARQLTERLRQCAPIVHISHPIQDNDTPLSPSRLISDIPHTQQTTPADPCSPIELDAFADDIAPPIRDIETIQGGSNLLKQMAACPFQAMANSRLKANAPRLPILGLSAADKGNLTHSALAIIWHKLKSHSALCALDEAALLATCQQAADYAIKQLPSHHEPLFIQAESARLTRRLQQWLSIEKERPPFAVLAHEMRIKTTLQGLPITLQVDRIDQLDSGEQLIIDYKTGFTHIASWFGERLEQPQLPLYALTVTQCDGISFAEIKPRSLQFKGLSKSDTGINGIKPISDYQFDDSPLNWSSLTTQWDKHLNKLAADFMAGVAMVDPLDDTLTCQYCDLKSLCRIAT